MAKVKTRKISMKILCKSILDGKQFWTIILRTISTVKDAISRSNDNNYNAPV